MIWIFKRYFWAVNLLVITAVAFFCSDIFLHLIEGRLKVSFSSNATSQTKKEPEENIRPESHYMNILERNLFDPSARQKVNELEPSAPSGSARPASGPIEESSGKLALRGTVIPVLSYSPAPDTTPDVSEAQLQQEARAIIEDITTRTQSLYSINQQVGDRKIVAIKKSEVILARPDGALERLTLNLDEKGQTDRSTFISRTAPPPSPSSSMVEKVSASSYVVNRDEVMKVVQNMSQFMTQLRARPHFQNGQPDGFFLTNIRRDSLVEQLGLRNGDVVKSINGEAITRPDELFQAYQQLQNQDSIELEIERKGETQTYSYTIQD